jgi:predicted nuclease of predicted toxin-antitoxin system
MLQFKKLKDGYIIRSADRFADVARIYGTDPEAQRLTKLFCASPEMETLIRKVIHLTETILTAPDIHPEPQKEETIKQYLQQLKKELKTSIRELEK